MSSHISVRWAASMLCALAFLLTAACSIGSRTGDDRDSSRPVDKGRDGPLTANSGSGGFAADAPDTQGRWYVTFENFVLCTNSDIQDIRLDGVRFATSPGSQRLRVLPMLRTFTLDEVRSASPKHRQDYAPYIGALLGKPPFDQPYAASFGGAGEYTAAIEGTEVTRSCAQTSAAEGALNMGAVPETTFTELVFVVTADRDGGTIKKAWLDYTADGEPRTLLIDWQMTACGIAVKRLCRS